MKKWIVPGLLLALMSTAVTQAGGLPGDDEHGVADAGFGDADPASPEALAQILFMIRKTGPATGTTEVHVMAPDFRSWTLNTGTPLFPTGTDLSWEFAVGDYNFDGVSDVYCIRKAGGVTGSTEVHVLDGANNYRSYLANLGTALGATGSDGTWTFRVVDFDRDGYRDLLGIRRSSTSATEVHVLSGRTSFQTWLLNVATPLGAIGKGADWDFGLGDYDRDGAPDLFVVKKQATLSGKTEVSVLSGATGFQTWLLQNRATILHATGSDSSWVFLPSDYNGDNKVDVVVVKKANTGTSTTEVHILDGATGYGSWMLQTPTCMVPTGTDNSHVWLLRKG